MTVLLAAFGIILSVCSTWIFIYNIFMCRGKLRRIVTLVNITIIMLFAVMLIANAAVKSSDKEYCTTGSVTQNTKYEATKNGYHRFVHNYIIDSEYIAVPDNLPLPRLVKIYPYVKIYEAKGCSGNNAISLEGTTYTLYSQAEIISPDIRPATTVFGVCLYAALIIFKIPTCRWVINDKKTTYLRDTICLKRVFWEIENVISSNYIDFCCLDTMFL